MDFKLLHHRLTKAFPELKAYLNHPLAPYTTVKIGGPADLFIQTSSNDELIKVLNFIDGEAIAANGAQRSEPRKLSGRKESSTGNAIASHPEITILGNGSNVLISDSGIRGIVIKNSDSSIKFSGDQTVTVASGASLPLLINQTINQSLSGLEEFAYIPASTGGAVWSNIHGVNKNNFDKFLLLVDFFDLKTRELKHQRTSELSWSYDFSEFQNHPEWIILSVTLRLSQADSNISKQLVSNIIAKKSLTQSMNSLGCVFKNPENDSAGRIIDQELNLKGHAIGDAQVSDKHANFIVNNGSATAADYLSLARLIQSQAKSKLGINLETEIKLLGQFD